MKIKKLVKLSVLCAFLFTGGVSVAQHIVNPIPELIQRSDLVVDLETFATIPAGAGYSSTRINMIRQLPDGSGRMSVIDLNGYLYVLDAAGNQSQYLNFNTEFSDFISSPGLGTGSGAVAFHPEFGTNGIFYTSHAESNGSGVADFSPAAGDPFLQWVIVRWVAADPSANVFSGTRSEILRFDFTGSIHGTQDITFNPYAQAGDADYGMLYLCNGDGGSSENYLFANVGTIESYLGAILRIDPEGGNSANGKYGIPVDNPYYDEPGAVKELWAYGFRNPHRLSFEVRGAETLLFVGDIGHHKIEEINLIEKGGNYGWDRREGTFIHDREHWSRGVLPLTGEDTVPYIYPVAQYDHGEGRAIALGHTWTASSDESLKGIMFFGDIPIGRLFHLPMDSLVQGRQYVMEEAQVSIDGGGETTFPEFHNNGRVDLRFSRNLSGELMLFTKINGRIYKVAGSGKVKPVAAFTADVEAGHAPLTMRVDAAASAGDNLTYSWDFGDGETATGVSVSHAYQEPGTYTLSLVVNDGTQDSEEISKTIYVYENPEAVILTNVNEGITPLLVILDGRTSTVDDRGTVSYEWNFGDGITYVDGYTTHTFEEEKRHEVVLRVEDGLGGSDSDTTWIEVKGIVLATSQNELKDLRLYPNPVKDKLTIETARHISMTFMSLSGRKLYHVDFDKGIHELDLRFLKKGVYLVQIATDSGERSDEMMIKH